MSEYHGKHEPRMSTTLDELLDGPNGHRIDVDTILLAARQDLAAWEESDRFSDAEWRAAEQLGSAFAVLDREAQEGNLPDDWKHGSLVTQWRHGAATTQWTSYQATLISMFGTCPCGGPRSTKNVTHGDSWRSVLYCTICGTEA